MRNKAAPEVVSLLSMRIYQGMRTMHLEPDRQPTNTALLAPDRQLEQVQSSAF